MFFFSPIWLHCYSCKIPHSNLIKFLTVVIWYDQFLHFPINKLSGIITLHTYVWKPLNEAQKKYYYTTTKFKNLYLLFSYPSSIQLSISSLILQNKKNSLSLCLIILGDRISVLAPLSKTLKKAGKSRIYFLWLLLNRWSKTKPLHKTLWTLGCH